MYKPQKTEAEQQDFFQKCYDRFLQAKTAVGEINSHYQIGGTVVCLKFAGDSLIPILTPALDHLRLSETTTADLTICIWDSESTGVNMIPPPCTVDCFTDRGDIWGFNSQRFKTAFHWVEDSVNLMDLETKVGVFWVQRAGKLPFWVHASPLRTLFHWWMEQNGCQLLHAAAIGTEKGAVLVTGKGGVGKSTTALSCLQAGLFYLADDYVATRLEPEPVVYSLYSTAKLNADHVEKFPDLSGHVSNIETMDREKAVMFLSTPMREQITMQMPLRAILTPAIVDRLESMISPVSKREIQGAMSFTTMSQLPNVGRYTHEYIGRLIDMLPHYTLEIGSVFERIPKAVSELLNQVEDGSLPCCTSFMNEEENTETPLISVVIPVYNGERFIREAVDNILSQKYPALEIIIVNDGSKDGTEDIIKRLPVDLRYFHQENAGPAAARNRGIRDTSGDFIAFLDVDDLWPENNLHTLMEEMHRHPEMEVVRGYAQLMEYDRGNDRFNFVGNPSESYPHYIGAGLYRKSVFEKVGLFDPTLRFGEDSDWYIRAAEKGINIKRLEETRLFVRRHGQNMTTGKNMVELNALKVFKKFLDRKRT
jgi:hypothetical protein